MEKIEARKTEAEKLLESLKANHQVELKSPALLTDFIKFAKGLKEVFIQGDTSFDCGSRLLPSGVSKGAPHFFMSKI